MNVDELVRATLRRKVALLVVLLCALAAGTYGVMSTTDSYESSAVAVVYPPGAGDIDAKLNPFVNLNDNMGQLAAVAATQLQSPTAVALVEEAGASAEYTVTSTLGDTAAALRLSPQLMITTSGPTPEAAQAGAQALLDYSSVALTELQVQTGVRPNTEALITAAIMPGPGTLVPASPLKAAGSYGLAVLVVGLLGIVTVGTILDRRRVTATATSGKKSRTQAVDSVDAAAVARANKTSEPVTDHNGWPVRELARASVERMNFAEDARVEDAGSDGGYSEDAHSDDSYSDDTDTAAFPAQTNGSSADVRWSAFGEPAEPARQKTTAQTTDEPANAEAVTQKAVTEASRSESKSRDSAPQRDRVAVKPPSRVHSTQAPKPPTVSDFDPFDFSAPQDPRTIAPRSADVAKDGFPARSTTPVREMEHEIDDYYGVEERVHVPIRSKHHDYPRSSITGGGPRR